jgi:glutamate N-acetyltransferase/amino-acid N-acetyltransferase
MEVIMTQLGITVPKGFKATGTACGLKKNGQLDLAIVVSDIDATCAGVFTKNIIKGHSLQWSRSKVALGLARAIVINSGCANACVGEQGDKDAEKMAEFAAELIGCETSKILLGSTGVIGFRLDLNKIQIGLQKAYPLCSENDGHLAAQAIMTTDTYAKEASCSLTISGHPASIAGMAKGSGMIHPNMATMISVLTTDVSITPYLLDKALKTIVDLSYNRVSVDGDTSVCDQVVILANGMAGNKTIVEENEDYQSFVNALSEVAISLSKHIARDGEGATKLIELNVINADSVETAKLILDAIAKSPLVKTAFFGQDANWGRIITAAGYSGATFDPSKIDISLGTIKVCEHGTAVSFNEKEALEILKNPEIQVWINLNIGSISNRMWTCDLSYDYVKINGSYRS